MAWISGIVAGVGSLASGAMSSKAASNAAGVDKQANAASVLEQERQFNIAQQSLAPYQAAGQTALDSMMGMLGLKGPKTTTPYGYSVQPWQTSMSPVYQELGLGGHGNMLPGGPGRSLASKAWDPANLLGNSNVTSYMSDFGGLPGLNNNGGGPFLARGGPAMGGYQGKDIIVGEEGPEVLHMDPGSTGHVTPNPMTMQRMMGMEGRAYGGPVDGYSGDGHLNIGQIKASAPAPSQPTMAGSPPAVAAPGTAPAAKPGAGGVTPFTNPASLSANQLMKQDPGYQFRLNQSMQALQNSSAASGGLLTGGFAKNALQLAGGYASSEFNNTYQRQYQQYTDMYNRLAAIAGIGQTSSSQLGSMGVYSGAQEGAYSSAYGNAGANGYINQANIGNNMFNNLGQAFGSSYQNSKNQQQTQPPGWGGVPYQ